MNDLLMQMLEQFPKETKQDKLNAVKEVIQEAVLCGLSRSGFFHHAAFYGGTALRIFYGLDRFSEDLDFSLKERDINFKLSDYIPALEKEIRGFGLHMTVSEKKKTKDSNIMSAFVKGNTIENLLLFYSDEPIQGIDSKAKIRVKFEIDTNPPAFAHFETKYRLLPAPYQVSIYDAPSLFAGKIHAVLARAWKNRIKGRDLYDYAFYISRNIPVNLRHLRERLIQSGTISIEDPFDLNVLKGKLYDRFHMIDYESAKSDVINFINDPHALDVWSDDFFCQITDHLHAEATR